MGKLSIKERSESWNSIYLLFFVRCLLSKILFCSRLFDIVIMILAVIYCHLNDFHLKSTHDSSLNNFSLTNDEIFTCESTHFSEQMKCRGSSVNVQCFHSRAFDFLSFYLARDYAILNFSKLFAISN